MSDSEVSTHQGRSGELLADISQALVLLYKECYGKGPTKAKTYISDDLVVCVLEGGFLKGERTLRDAGHEAAVSDQREAIQGIMRQRFIDTIEELTGREVKSYISGIDLHTETNADVFVLTPELDVGDELAAIHAWAVQTRRQSRLLREEQAKLREQQAGLTREKPSPPGEPGLTHTPASG